MYACICMPVQDMRGYFSEVVGMLRDKEGQVEDLRTAAFSSLQSCGGHRRKRRLLEQEDSLCCIKEVYFYSLYFILHRGNPNIARYTFYNEDQSLCLHGNKQPISLLYLI